jgi:hypothetical protein
MQHLSMKVEEPVTDIGKGIDGCLQISRGDAPCKIGQSRQKCATATLQDVSRVVDLHKCPPLGPLLIDGWWPQIEGMTSGESLLEFENTGRALA